MASTAQAAAVLGISAALLSAGGIATLSLFDVPILRSQPASRSLPSIRWLFSRGSHIFPTAGVISTSAFAYLSYDMLHNQNHTMTDIKVVCYMTAAVLTASIGPLTRYMVPTNFRLIQKNEDAGGARSVESAKSASHGRRRAEESVAGKDDIDELRDVSGPQEKAEETTEEDDEEVGRLLARFGFLNSFRAVLMGVGGIVGLVGALSA